jgi:hypothetical protein
MLRNFVLYAICLAAVFIAGCGSCPCRGDAAEKNWRYLFDGQTFAGWRGMNSDKFPEKGWRIENRELICVPAEGSGGDIITVEQFSDFVLELEFKITQGANSGIKYLVDESLSKGKGGIGLEYQILDDLLHPDAKNGKNGNRTIASLYDLIPADKGKPVEPVGQWNKAKIICRGMHVEHWLNGRKVLEYERNSPQFRQIVAESKFKDISGFALAQKGHILLQDHGDRVYFRNIKLRRLDVQ